MRETVGLLGKKQGMTQIFGKDGSVTPVTVIEAGPCVVVQKKTEEKDRYNAIQLGFGKRVKVSKSEEGHIKKRGITEFPEHLREIRLKNVDDFNVGQVLKVDMFKAGELIDVEGISIGKGFQGTVKRWHTHRGPMAHGSKFHRIPGSIGSGTTPARVVKGRKMAGRMGGEKVCVKNLSVVSVDPAKNLLLLSGAVPGKRGNLLIIRKAR